LNDEAEASDILFGIKPAKKHITPLSNVVATTKPKVNNQ
jgi:hypothetical protein